MIATIFNELLYKPLFNLLVFFYNVVPGHDFGVAIILVTLLIRTVLFPLSKKGIKSRKALEELQPKIKELRKKYKDKEEQARETMKLYKEHKVNPASGCLPVLIQLPIFIALYRLFINISEMITNNGQLEGIYSSIVNPGTINPMFLGLVNLAIPNIFLAILAGVLQFIQGKLMMTSTTGTQSQDQKKSIQQTMGRQMTYFMPLLIVFISLKLPAGLPLYWAVTTLFGIGEHLLVNRKGSPASKTT